MNVGGKRQLPSWMVRTTATEHATNSETKVQNKENDSVKVDIVEPVMKKFQAKKHENGAPLNENELQMLKKCEARTRKRKSNKYEEGQAQENESCSLKPCEFRSNKHTSHPKHVEDRVDDLFEKDLDKKEDGLVRKRARNNDPRKKPSEKLKGKFDDLMVESGSSDDELTVDDIVSIAEEYVKAERIDSQKSNLEQDAISLHKSDTQIGSGKHLTTHRETSSVNDVDQSLSSYTSLAKHSTIEGHITDSSTSDITRSMIDLFLGPNFRKKLEEVDRKTD